QVSGRVTSTAGVRFANINATYPNQFQTFSAPRLFTPLGSQIYDVKFFVPSTNTPATVSGFGAVFTDVEVLGSTSITVFDVNDVPLIPPITVPPDGTGGLSFAGVSFNAGERIAHVRIVQVGGPIGPNDISLGGPYDVVAADDFIYVEPHST